MEIKRLGTLYRVDKKVEDLRKLLGVDTLGPLLFNGLAETVRIGPEEVYKIRLTEKGEEALRKGTATTFWF